MPARRGVPIPLVVLLLLATAGATWVASQAADAPQSVSQPDTALEDEVRRLRREAAELREKLDRRPRVRAQEPSAPATPPAAGDAETAQPSAAAPGLRLARALVPAAEPPLDDRTVAQLVESLRAAVAGDRAEAAKRFVNALIARGDASVAALLDIVRNTSEPGALRDAALDALAALRAPGLAALVENLYLSQRPTDPAEIERRRRALGAAVGADPEAAVPVVKRLLWSSDASEREAAFAGLSRARDAAFLPILREEVMREGAPAAATNLSDTIAQIRGPRWAALQAAGPPDTAVNGDIGAAWASKTADMGEVWLELDYEAAVAVESVRIRETYNPGAVARIDAVLENGTRETLWEGKADVQPAPRWFEPPLRAASGRVRTIRVVIDTNRVPGWNEIDAVELLGEGRRQWASAARASSSYADP